MHTGRVNFRTALLAMALIAAASATRAAEPIRFSGRTGPAQQILVAPREPFLPAEARDLRARSRPELPSDTFMLPAQSVTPTTGLTRRQLEDQERRRNWLLQSPDALREDAAKSDADRAREARDDNSDRANPTSPNSRHLEGPDRINDPAAKNRNPGPGRPNDRDRNTPDNRDANSSDDKLRDTRSAWEPRANAQLRSGPEANGWLGADAIRGSGLSRAMAEARERERERERTASLEAFRRSFDNPWAQTTANPANPATTRTTAPTLLAVPGTDARRMTAPGALAPGPRATTDFSPRGGGAFDPANPLNYGSAGTVFRAPEPTLRLPPKPIVLEVPKRKF